MAHSPSTRRAPQGRTLSPWLLLPALAGLFMAAIALEGLRALPGQALPHTDLLVVLGNTVYPDGEPSPRLQARLDTALAAYRQGAAPRILVSGGIGREGQDEAQVMARYLHTRGVPTEALLVDSAGANTWATARHARQWLPPGATVTVVSQYHHIPRARLALACQGFPEVAALAAPYGEWRDLYALPRETLAYGAYRWRCLGRPRAHTAQSSRGADSAP